YHADGKVARAAERYADYIKGETMMVRMEPGQPGEGYASQEWTVEGERFVLWLRRCSQAAGG
ncbi:MAG: hypothetical protein ACYC6V_08260, partial [Bacillota bacterium]